MAGDNSTPSPLSEPDDEENVVMDTAPTEPLRNAKIEEPREGDPEGDPESTGTDRARFISPRFGSAGSGGAELEPGPGRAPGKS